ADEELGMGDVAAGDASGLLLVEALGELHALVGERAARVERAHGTRELAHLEEELHRERPEALPREATLGDPEPERMATERPSRLDRRLQVVDEGSGGGHGRDR